MLSLFFFSHNARLYQSGIARIKSSTITSTQMKEYNGIKETYLLQSLEAQLLNGAYEGETIVAHHIQLELLRFVSGSIVLLMAIPISTRCTSG